jgi:two-component system cell cycle sensor histidine kinase/response regulator CckA
VDGNIRDRAVALLQTLPAEAGAEQVLGAVRALAQAEPADPAHRERESDRYQSEPRFRLIFESSALGIALVDVAGRLLQANRALGTMLRCDASELAGKSFAEITHPDDIALDYQLYLELLQGKRTHYQIEKRYLRKDRSIAWGRLTASLVQGERGTGVFGIGLVEDITEIRAARDEQNRLVLALNDRVRELTALHRTASLLQDEALPSSILFTRVASLLPQAFEAPEQTAARISYGNLSTTTPGYRESDLRLAASFRTIDAKEGSIEVVFHRALRDGVAAFHAEERTLLDSIAEMLRVTLDRRLADQARHRSDERLNLALSATGLGLWEWDLSTDRMIWSEHMERLAGLEPGTFPGTFGAFTSLTHPDDRAVVQSMFTGAINDATRTNQCEAEFRFVMLGKGERWVAVKGRVLRDDRGRPVRLIGVGLDVTTRRTLEDQLHQAQKMEAIGRLAGGVAHDFNNLLTVIAGNCDLLLADLAEGNESRELVSEVREAAERAGGLTRQLLTFSRKNVVQPTVIDLRHSLSQLEAMLRRLIGENIELRTRVASDAGHVRADAGQLEQVLLNLVVNARDAMPNGGTLTIEVENVTLDEAEADKAPRARAGAYAVLTVTDTGCGMDPLTLARIFEPFFTTKPADKGTGLGLSVAFGIVRQSDGHITVESEPGRGSSFRVYLPRVDETSRATAPPLPLKTLPRGRESVLVVEDEVMLRKIVRTVLLAQGYRVFDAAGGRDAIALLATAGPIDLVVTDVVLPGLSGREVVEAVRKLRPDVGVLFISGYADDALIREGVLKSEVGFLQKPFSPSILAHKVREVLDARRALKTSS